MHFIQAMIALENKNYILISDTESYNTWIEIERDKDLIYTSVIQADKPMGITAVEYAPVPNKEYTEWKKQETDLRLAEVKRNGKKI